MESVSYVLENSEDARNAHRPNVYHARHDSSLLRLENAISVNQRCLDAYSVKIRVHVIVVNSDISWRITAAVYVQISMDVGFVQIKGHAQPANWDII